MLTQSPHPQAPPGHMAIIDQDKKNRFGKIGSKASTSLPGHVFAGLLTTFSSETLQYTELDLDSVPPLHQIWSIRVRLNDAY